MKLNGVFQGGGIKGIGLVGAINRFHEEGVQWESLAGTSAGAIIASLMAVGYNGKELKEIVENIHYKKFKDKEGIQKLPFLKGIGLIFTKGLYSTNYIENFLGNLYKKKGKTKFKHISIKGNSKLKIIAADVTNSRMVILPEDISFYGIDPMELDIAKAVAMSISIPFYFSPIKLNHNNKDYFIVDGGLVSNFPIWIFDTKENIRYPTIGFKFEELQEEYAFRRLKFKFLSYIKDVIETSLECYDERFIREEDKIRTISIPTLGIRTTNFNISYEKLQELFKAGYESADEFLKGEKFSRYMRTVKLENYYRKRI